MLLKLVLVFLLPVFISATNIQEQLLHQLSDHSTGDDFNNTSLHVARLQLIAKMLIEQRIHETSDATELTELLILLGLAPNRMGARSVAQSGTLFNTITSSFQDITEYGCWCKLAYAGEGFGTPMDDIDSACKVFQHCRKCILIDAVTGDSCDPVNKNYELVSSASLVDIASGCATSNPLDICAAKTCSCEVQFVSQVLSIFFSAGTGYTSSYAYASGFFQADECSVQVTGTTDWQCCGSYPEIMPYAKSL